jgi:hypothetical protein
MAGAAGATVSAVSMPVIAEQINKMDAPDAVKQATPAPVNPFNLRSTGGR